MPIAGRTPTSGTAASGAGFSITLPAGCTTGDLIVLAVSFATTGSGPSTPTGWTFVGNYSSGTGQTVSIYWAYYSPSLALSLTNVGALSAWACNSFFQSGALLYLDGTPVNTNNTTNNTTMACGAPTATGNVAGDYEVLVYSWGSSATITTVATGSTIDKTQANSTTISVAIGHANATLAANGVATAFSNTLSASNSRKSGLGMLLMAVPVPAAAIGISDNFDGGSLNAAWSAYGTGQSVTPAPGALQVAPPGTSGVYGGVLSASTFNLTGNYAYVRFTARLLNTVGTVQSLQLQVDGSNYLEFLHLDGNLVARRNVAGTITQQNSIAWPTTNLFVRIHESGGACYWMYSTDRVNWTMYSRFPNPFAVTALQVNILAGCYQTVGVPGTARWNYLNTAVPVSGSSAGSTTVSGQPSARRSLSGSSAGSATENGQPAARRSLSGSSAGSATEVGQPAARRALSGSAPGAATTSALISKRMPTVPLPSTAILGTPRSLLGTLILGAPSPLLAGPRNLSGAAAGTSSTTAVVTRRRSLVASSVGVAVATATVNRRRALVVASAGVAVTSAAASARRSLSGSSVGRAVTAADFIQTLRGSSIGRATASAAVNARRALSGLTAGTSSTATALLSTKNRNLSGASVGTSGVAAAISRRRALVTSGAIGQATTTATLAARRSLLGAAAGLASVATALLNRKVSLLGTALGTSSVAAVLQRVRTIAPAPAIGTSTTSSPRPTAYRALLGHADGVTVASGLLTSIPSPPLIVVLEQRPLIGSAVGGLDLFAGWAVADSGELPLLVGSSAGATPPSSGLAYAGVGEPPPGGGTAREGY